MTLATALGFLGIAVYLASNQAFSMLSLSDQYAAATTDAQRSMFLAAGRRYLRIIDPDVLGPGAIGFFLVTLAGLIFSIVMLRSSIFAKGNRVCRNSGECIRSGRYPLGIAFAPKDSGHSCSCRLAVYIGVFPGDMVRLDRLKALPARVWQTRR